MDYIENYSIFEGIDYGPLFTRFPPTTTPSLGDIVNENLTMTVWVQLCWTVVFAVMIFTAITGNCIIIWAVLAHKSMRTVTNYFLVNLSVADLLLSTLNCIFNFVYMLQGNWQFGNIYCTINNFVANVTVAASVFTLTGITCDRYLAIVHPLQHRMSKTVSIVTIAIIWFTSMVLACPCLLYSNTIVYKFKNKERTACILLWPDGPPTRSNLDFGYQVTFLALTYVIPMLLMLWCYSIMGVTLWGSKSIGEQTQRQIRSVKSKRKIVKMFIFIVTFFCVCWFPYHGYFVYTHIDRKVVYSRYVQHVFLGFYWFAMANAMVNPLIYYWMNARFRQYYKIALCSWQKVIGRSLTENAPIAAFQMANSKRSGTRENLRTSLHLQTYSQKVCKPKPDVCKNSC